MTFSIIIDRGAIIFDVGILGSGMDGSISDEYGCRFIMDSIHRLVYCIYIS